MSTITRDSSDGLIALVLARQALLEKSNRKIKRDCDFALYAERNLVERFFIKHYRGIATRYEKPARNFLAGLHLVSWSAHSLGSNDDTP